MIVGTFARLADSEAGEDARCDLEVLEAGLLEPPKSELMLSSSGMSSNVVSPLTNLSRVLEEKESVPGDADDGLLADRFAVVGGCRGGGDGML